MTRRALLTAACCATGRTAFGTGDLVLSVHQVMDGRARCTPSQLREFSETIWPEAERDFGRCGLRFAIDSGPGEIRRSPSDAPIFVGLQRARLNLVLTDLIPMNWDRARGLAGLTTVWQGYHVCVIALEYAHPNRIPFVAVNTCEHELLHAILQDIFENRPAGLAGEAREMRIDAYATRLWLFHEGADVRESARAYIDRLRSGPRATAAVPR